MDETDLPTLINNDLAIEPFTPLSPLATLDEIIETDTNITNNLLEAVHGMFPKVVTIKGACTLIATTMKVLEQRRKVLLLNHVGQNKVPTINPLIPLS